MKNFEQALQSLPQALHPELLRHWQSYLENAERQQIAAPADATFVHQLLRVWATSDFVARACVREPRLLEDLLGSGDLHKRYPPQHYQTSLESRLTDIDNDKALASQLRRYRRREMIRIAWRDLAGLAVLQETLQDLSDLADAAIDVTLNKLHGWQCQRFGTPHDDQENAQQLVVLGMGKLGGQELNFSSDIDLIFAYPRKGQTDGKRSISNEEFFRKLGQRLIKTLQEITPEGFVYRVDMRLRPFGEAGPLAMPFSAFEDYYQNHGRDWERYAMIKARIVAGDKSAGARLLDDLKPFIYRRYLDYSAFESLRNMKALISKEVERKGLQRNIKLGPGGIREIEFIAQAFQLIYGGREPQLRQRQVLPVLTYLVETERLDSDVVDRLRQAYGFLRRSENRLQAWADQQTHDLPDDETAKLRLAYAMDFPSWQEFSDTLQNHIRHVREPFALVFSATPQPESEDNGTGIDFNTLWNADSGDEAALDYLRDQGFAEPAVVLTSLQALHDSFSYRALSEQGRTRLKQLLPLLLQAVGKIPDAAVTLQRIVELLREIARRTVYLSLLVESPTALTQLVKLCAISPWIAHYLARYPLLLDDLLNPAMLYKPLDGEQLEQELNRDLERVANDDVEQQINELRHFKQTNVLRVAAADVSGVMPLMIVSDYLTEIAEVLLRRILQIAWSDLSERFGTPHCVVDGESKQPEMAIIGYGKLGGIELSYSSDLDLVFLHDSSGEHQHTSGPKEIDNASFFVRLAQRMIHIISTHTAAGVLYEVDTRLRPSGRSGLLVSSFTAFADYQQNQAWTWEHQALVRARFIAGPEKLRQQFAELRRDILCRPRERQPLCEEVGAMRERMRSHLGSGNSEGFDIKQDRGGIADIEFMVQYLVLAYAQEFPELTRYSDNIRQLAGFELTGILTSGDVAQLRDSYRALRRYVHLTALQEKSAAGPDPELIEHRRAVTQLWEQIMKSQTN